MAANNENPALSPENNRVGLVYDGLLGELFVLWLKTVLLSIITLGFYRFWGRTRIRKYLWSRVSLNGDRFEYDGTGGELFRRFLVALVVLIPLLALPSVLPLLGASFTATQIVQLITFLVLLFLIQVGRYGGRRYRLSRTLWRGIRGGLDGSSIIYALISFKYFLLMPFTLGLALAWQQVGLWRYEMNNTGLGDMEFKYEGSGRKLLKPLLIAYLLVIVGLLLALGLLVVIAMIAAMTGGQFKGLDVFEHLSKGDDPTENPAAFAFMLLLLLVIWACFLLPQAFAMLYFQSRSLRYLASGTTLGDVHFTADIGFWPLLRLTLGNLAILILTLGTGSAFIAQRDLRFFCRYVTVYGQVALDILTQQPGRRTKDGGEGLMQLLDTTGFA